MPEPKKVSFQKRKIGAVRGALLGLVATFVSRAISSGFSWDLLVLTCIGALVGALAGFVFARYLVKE
ncbi:hypothetical protein [Streptomyces sp. NPDC006285]|uniref:hypothetical protein n=1 Tax=Streptomyces sp. NPDC006285 TaxID=3364742 RepID=UPI0036C42912